MIFYSELIPETIINFPSSDSETTPFIIEILLR